MPCAPPFNPCRRSPSGRSAGPAASAVAGHGRPPQPRPAPPPPSTAGMAQTAAILNQASDRSLVILDEIGRGTATFDGLSIAWASVEHLHEVNRCRSLFATHFHELTVLSEKLKRLANVTMRVKEWDGDVIFLHEVGPGAADRSYGIQVARLAGLPASVVARAREVLSLLEDADRKNPAAKLIDALPLFQAAIRREEPKPAKASKVDETLL